MKYDVDKAFKIANTLESAFIDLWCAVCEAESPTSYKSGVDAAVNVALELARKNDWKIEIQEEEISGSPACITMNPDVHGIPLVLSGHLDTVHAVGSFGDAPVHIEGDKIYGPGVCDCKGGVVAALYAMSVLDQCGYDERPIKLILQTDEETSSIGSDKRTVDFMYECAKGTDTFINMEGYNPGKATVGRKGILKYEAEITGIPMHSSLCYEGASAIREAAHKIIELEKLQDKDGITFNCGVIQGGTTSNTVAGKCTFSVDIRFKNDEQYKQAVSILEGVMNTSYLEGTSARLIKSSERCAMEAHDRNYKLLDALNSAFEKAGLPVLQPAIRTGGSDAADMTSRGIPCIDSLGVTGGYIHTSKEYAYLASLKESCRRIVAVALSADLNSDR